jgi:hypothetical protein
MCSAGFEANTFRTRKMLIKDIKFQFSTKASIAYDRLLPTVIYSAIILFKSCRPTIAIISTMSLLTLK